MQRSFFLLLSIVFLTSPALLGQACATPGKDGNATGGSALGTGPGVDVVNTYYPATSFALAGETFLFLGTPSGAATPITAGDLILVIQIQDASINSTNTGSYGDGVAGNPARGTTSDNIVGQYEFVRATSTVSGGFLNIEGATPGSGLINNYDFATASGTQGQQIWQAIRVPQYENAEITGSVGPLPWDGTVGGVFAIDVENALTFSGAGTVTATGLGFRGGGGRQLTGGGPGTNSDYRNPSSSNLHGPKGEGIAGAPDFVHESFTGAFPGTVVATGTNYPNGGSARGAPGNAGGGGTDGDAINAQNSGGGGGGNGGFGGNGGNSWFSNLAIGGFGGASFASASINRLVMGGGAGSGTNNNSTGITASGGAGGGLIIVCAGSITGTGAIEANGITPSAANGLLPGADGSGGGGAGGTIVVLADGGSLANISLNADGGNGGDNLAAVNDFHGPGGGGGGGIIYVNDLLTGTVSVTGGQAGLSSGSNFGATAGTDGNAFINAQISGPKRCGFVPVSLAYFLARPQPNGRILVEWATATETANLGFHILGLEKGQFQKQTLQLIPSRKTDTTEPQFYRTEIRNTGATAFVIEDIDRFGKRSRSVSFGLGKVYGEKPSVETIPWQQIRFQSERLRHQRSRFTRDTSQLKADIWVSQPGMQHITFEALVSAGIDFSGVPTDALALTYRGKPVPIRIGAANKGQTTFFGPGLFIQFLGQISESLYSKADIYQLRIDSQLAVRMPEVIQDPKFISRPQTSYTATMEREQNNQYAISAPHTDPWFDTAFLAVEQPEEFDFECLLSDRVPGTPATLNIRGYGLTNYPNHPDHHVEIYFNDFKLGQWIGDGLEILNLDLKIPEYMLENGNNQLTFRLPLDRGNPADLVHLEGFSIQYQRRLKTEGGKLQFESPGRHFHIAQVTDPSVLVFAKSRQGMQYIRQFRFQEDKDGTYRILLENPDRKGLKTSFWVIPEQQLARPEIRLSPPTVDITSGELDFLMIAHPDFISGLQPLVQAREAQGLNVQVVDVEQAFRKFSHGRPSARAIEALIANAYQRGARHVLLVGGDTYDYHGNLGIPSMSFVPTRYVRTGPIVGFAPSDAALTDFDRDGIPNLAIGRFPVRTQAELDVLIQKTLQYPTASHAHSSIFVAGEDEPAISFTGFNDHLISLQPKGWEGTRAYVDELGLPDAKALFVSTVNQGVELVNFFGHSGPTTWTFNPLLTAAQAESLLTNNGKPTVITQWGCWNTYFVAPTYNTMAHKFLLGGQQGAALVIGASTLTKVSAETKFAPVFFKHLFSNNQTIGSALQLAKEEVGLEFPNMRGIMLGLQLLGDPTMALKP